MECSVALARRVQPIRARYRRTANQRRLRARTLNGIKLAEQPSAPLWFPRGADGEVAELGPCMAYGAGTGVLPTANRDHTMGELA